MKRAGSTALPVCLIVVVLVSASSAQKLTVPEVSRDKIICFALYTVQDNILKLTAQLYPLEPGESRTVRLETKRNGKWRQIAQTKVIKQGWTAPFRVENWDSTRDVEYRVAHGDSAFYTGTIVKDPVDRDVIVVAAFTGNSINPGHGGDIAKSDIVENIKKIKPDLLFFSGDQVYDHFKHYAAWLKFGRDFGEIIRNIPTVTIPDDHDVGQANLWGQGGRPSYTRAGHDGGYAAPVDYVKEVERAQTSHLPDPFDPTPIERGIGVYYTDLTIGRVSFAIIEDRKFKTGPAGLLPDRGWRPNRPDHISVPGYDPMALDVPEARLLGERQLKFLRHWAADWRDCDMKAVLSQTIFAGGAHIHGKIGNRLLVDLDSNGWPQTGRDKALAEFRKAFALMIAGDQHLATIIHHGVNDWNDSGYSMCVPSIANLYLRWWAPLEPGKNREPGAPEHTGEFLDGLGNK
ncbi:MAG: metallophosphoesterase, partial [Phycisphaerales bacterium]